MPANSPPCNGPNGTIEQPELPGRAKLAFDGTVDQVVLDLRADRRSGQMASSAIHSAWTTCHAGWLGQGQVAQLSLPHQIVIDHHTQRSSPTSALPFSPSTTSIACGGYVLDRPALTGCAGWPRVEARQRRLKIRAKPAHYEETSHCAHRRCHTVTQSQSAATTGAYHMTHFRPASWASQP